MLPPDIPPHIATIDPDGAAHGAALADEIIAKHTCPACGWMLIDGCCTPECEAIRAEDARENGDDTWSR